jgi:hypothetical protein
MVKEMEKWGGPHPVLEGRQVEGEAGDGPTMGKLDVVVVAEAVVAVVSFVAAVVGEEAHSGEGWRMVERRPTAGYCQSAQGSCCEVVEVATGLDFAVFQSQSLLRDLRKVLDVNE